MSRDAIVYVAIGAILIVVVGALALGLAGGSVTTTVSDSGSSGVLIEPPDDGSYGVVSSRFEDPGDKLLGIPIRSASYTLHVALVVPTECVVAEGQNERITDEGDCATLPAHGEVSGGGVSRDGQRFVFVRQDVSKACYEAIATGDRWPPDVAACSE